MCEYVHVHAYLVLWLCSSSMWPRLMLLGQRWGGGWMPLEDGKQEEGKEKEELSSVVE